MEKHFLYRKNIGGGSCNLRYPSTIRRRSFHRPEQQQSSKKLSNNENTLPCLLYHKHHPQDKTLPNYKEISQNVCKIKSNSMPRSFVERKQRRKRTKMCKKGGNKIEQKLSQGSLKDQPNKEMEQPVSECLKFDSISPLPPVLNNFIPKSNKNEGLVYL